MKKTLIVIDFQNDFVNGVLGTPEAQAIIPEVKEKVAEYLRHGNEVIFTRDTHYENYMDTLEGKKLPVSHCVFGTDGWRLVDGLEGIEECCYYNKETFGFKAWPFLTGEPELIEIIGVCTDICVITNALLLKTVFPELPIVVDASCCAGTTPEKHKAALEVMKSCQITVVGENND